MGALTPERLAEIRALPLAPTAAPHSVMCRAISDLLKHIDTLAGEWRPIEEAEKRDGIWLQVVMNGEETRGTWETDKYSPKPRPYWRSQMGYLMGITWDRKHQPTHFRISPAPPKPKVTP